MWKRTIEYSKRQTPAQRKAHKEYLEKQDADAVIRCNALRFWRVCRHGECKRRHSCSGNPHDCFREKWALWPEESKVWLRAAIKARLQGLDCEMAARAANAEVTRWQELTAKFEAMRGAPSPEPRIRTL